MADLRRSRARKRDIHAGVRICAPARSAVQRDLRSAGRVNLRAETHRNPVIAVAGSCGPAMTRDADVTARRTNLSTVVENSRARIAEGAVAGSAVERYLSCPRRRNNRTGRDLNAMVAAGRAVGAVAGNRNVAGN